MQCKGQRTRSIPVQHMISIHMSQAAIKLPLNPTKCEKKKTEREISPVLDGPKAFLWNHVCKSKINPSEKSVTEVLRWFQYSFTVLGHCSSAGSVCCWQRCDTLFIPGLRGGRHRNYPSFAIGSKRNPTSLCHVDWCVICLVTLRVT